MTTAELWGAIRAEAGRLGLDRPGVSAADVSRLRGAAGQIQARSDALSATAGNRAIRSDLISRAPWAEPVGGRSPLPRFQVRFAHTFTLRGVESTEWRTVMINSKLPRTVGELRDMIDADAEQIARGYQGEHVGIGALQVIQV